MGVLGWYGNGEGWDRRSGERIIGKRSYWNRNRGQEQGKEHWEKGADAHIDGPVKEREVYPVLGY